MSIERLVIVDGVRTPFCKMGTELAALARTNSGRIAVNALLTRTGIDPALMDEVIFGCVAQPADAANVARVIALRAGIPESVPAITVHRNCASGCEAITQAQEKMLAGRGSIFVVGGAESMSNIPLLFKPAAAEKFGRLARAKLLASNCKALAAFRPTDFQAAHRIAARPDRSGLRLEHGRDRRIAGARIRHQPRRAGRIRAALAPARRRRARKTCGGNLPGFPSTDGNRQSSQDNGPRENQSLAALAKFKPVFDRKNGTVTAGNSSQITDGAVALLVMSEQRAEGTRFHAARSFGRLRLRRLRSGADGTWPVLPSRGPKTQTGLNIADADLIEINEAFAAQVLARR